MMVITIVLMNLIALVSGDVVEVVAHLKHSNLELLENQFWKIADPSDVSYGNFLNVGQVRDMIGAQQDDIELVKDWLVSIGGDPLSAKVSNLADSVSVSFKTTPSFSELSKNSPHCVDFVLKRSPKKLKKELTSRRNLTHLNEALSEYTVSNIKKAYGIPTDHTASNDSLLQMVWGPGTFGYSKLQLEMFKATEVPLLNMSRVQFDTENHGESGGDNFGEGMLDTKMISAFGLNVNTLVSNTNTSASTEEGSGFGQALLDFLTSLASRETLPHVLSMSLGSLAASSCQILCDQAVKNKGIERSDCESFLQQQRQVCMFLSESQAARIDTALQVLGSRGVSIFGSSGDGGSHFSFGPFQGDSKIANALNEISCEFQLPVFPTASPYVVSVGGEMWENGDSKQPITWTGFGGGSGGGFSWSFPMPSYQRDAVQKYLQSESSSLPPSSSFNASGRAYPDISAIGVDGTSQSCPIMAGIFSLVIDARLNNGLGRLGFLGNRIWKVATSYPGEAFEDIAKGNSGLSCGNGFASSSNAWDPNTGFGRPIWSGLLKHFASDDHL